MHKIYLILCAALLIPVLMLGYPVERTTTISFGLTYGGVLPLSAPRVQFVAEATGIVLGEFPLELDQAFSLTYDATEPYYLIGLADVVGENRSLYATPGGLSDPTIYPADASVINAGILSLEELAPPSRDVVGTPYQEEDRILIPLEHRFFVYAPEYSDHFYREGDFLYHKKHLHRYQGETYTLTMPDGTVWEKVSGLVNGDSWSRVEVTDHTGAMLIYIFRYLEHSLQIGNQTYNAQILVKTNCHNIMVNKTVATSQGTYRFWYVNDLVVRKELVTAPSDPLVMSAGDTWLYTPVATEPYPNTLSYDPSALFGEVPRLVLNWQAPSADGLHTWTHYRVYANGQLLGEIPFNLTNFISTEIVPGTTYQISVRAFDGTVESSPSPEVVISTVAGSDPIETAIPMITTSPNPFCGDRDLTIRITEPISGSRISIYNLRGQEVATIPISTEKTEYSWNGRSKTGSQCAPGIYLIKQSGATYPMTKILLSPLP